MYPFRTSGESFVRRSSVDTNRQIHEDTFMLNARNNYFYSLVFLILLKNICLLFLRGLLFLEKRAEHIIIRHLF